MFLREHIGPALRRLGLRGSGVSFELPDDRSWALVGLQADWRMARAGIVHFTVNLTFADKSAWAATRGAKLYYPERPSANSSYGMDAEVIRIGELVPVAEDVLDRWWTLRQDHPPEQTAAEVVAAIRDHGLPWLRSRIASSSGDIDAR